LEQPKLPSTLLDSKTGLALGTKTISGKQTGFGACGVTWSAEIESTPLIGLGSKNWVTNETTSEGFSLTISEDPRPRDWRRNFLSTTKGEICALEE
jgi:hypothetical protein